MGAQHDGVDLRCRLNEGLLSGGLPKHHVLECKLPPGINPQQFSGVGHGRHLSTDKPSPAATDTPANTSVGTMNEWLITALPMRVLPV